MKKSYFFSKRIAMLLAIAMLCVMLTACGDAYSEYASAYNKISANGGINADIKATMVMDGETRVYSGNFKVDNKSNILYYEMTSDGQTTVQFSDGSYLYVQRGNEKIKYALNGEKPAGAQNQRGDAPGTAVPEFNTSDFLNEFASFLDAGKIRELGLLSAVEKAAVSKTTKNGDTYTLDVSESIVKKFINTLAVNQSGNSESVQVKDLQNFKYTVTVKDGIVTACVYSGDVVIGVPASLMADGNAKEYSMKLTINIDFVNPGTAVTVDIPATDEYQQVASF